MFDRIRFCYLAAVVLAAVAVSACSSSDSPSNRADITPEALASLQAELAALQDQVAMLMDRADITPADLQALQDQVATLMERADVTPADLQALQDQVATLMERADVTPTDLQALQDQVATLMQRADVTPADLQALQDQVAMLMQRADITPADLQALQDQVAELMQRADITPADLQALQDQLAAAERGLILPSPAELREAFGVTTEPAAVDFRAEIARTSQNASAVQFSRAHQFVSWQNDVIRYDVPECGGRWCNLEWDPATWFSPSFIQPRLQADAHHNVMLRNGVRLGQWLLAEPMEPYSDAEGEGQVSVNIIGYGGLLHNGWFGVLLDDEKGTWRSIGSEDAYYAYEQALVEAVAFGAASYAPIDPAGGSARWEGVMVGRDVGMPVVTALNLIQGDATLEYDFTDMNVDVTFDSILDITAGTSRESMSWTDIPVEDWGEFEDSGEDGDYIFGTLYGQNHAEAGGVFERNSIVGAFGASNSSRYVSPAADAVYLGLADKLADVARYNRKYDGDTPLTAYNHSQSRFPESGSEQVTWSQNYRGGDAVNSTVPWRASDGTLKFHFDAYRYYDALQDAPVAVYSGQFIALGDHFTDTRDTLNTLQADLGLGATWEAVQATQTYGNGASLAVEFVTDLGPAEPSAPPWIRNVDGAQPAVELDDVPALPADLDYLWVPVPTSGLDGSLNGARGQFACADGPGCGFVLNPEEPILDGFFPSDGNMVFTPDDGSSPVAVPHASNGQATPRTDYLAFGSWQFVPADTTDMAAYQYGVFASGGDPFFLDNLLALTGTANYAGQAVGKYARAPAFGGTAIETFVADVELTAEFGTGDTFGKIGGRLFNVMMDDGQSAPLAELDLQARSWRNAEANIFTTFEGGPPSAGGWVEGFTQGAGDDWAWNGAWGGAFFGNDPSSTTAHPTGVGGTFGASDGASSVVGSFGAHRQ